MEFKRIHRQSGPVFEWLSGNSANPEAWTPDGVAALRVKGPGLTNHDASYAGLVYFDESSE